MDTVHPGGAVVVGVDGSDSARRAVRWAAAEAALRHAPLRLVSVFTALPPGRFGDPSRSGSYRRHLVETGQAALDAAAGVAGEVAPGVEVQPELREGFPGPVLLAASRDAVLTVVGSRGLGGFIGLLAGSIAVALAARGGSPVVVVRGDEVAPEAGGAETPDQRPVLVGVDGSPASEAAIGLAFDEAALRGAPLQALHSWLDHGLVPALAAGIDWATLETEEHVLLAQRLAGWSQKYPDVDVRRVVERDRPAHALVTASAAAQLVVVGSRGRGGGAGLFLGSVSHALLHHSRCPVMVARPPEEDDDR